MKQKRTRPPGRRRLSRGFTFIELLQVAGIVGILFAIAVPAYNDYLKRARVAEAIVQLGDARVAVNDFFARWGYLPADNAEAGLLPPDEIKGKYLRRLEVTNGALRARVDLGRDVDKNPVLQTLSLRPLINTSHPTAPIVWFCGKGDPKVRFPEFAVNGEPLPDSVEDRFLPATCRSK
jgi:type IV pilus assembly protein PilA